MSGSDEDQDFSKFKDDAGDIKPIDIAGGAAAPVRRATANISTEVLREGAPPPADAPGNELIAESEETANNIVKKGDFIDLLKLVPSLNQIMVGVGWELKNLEGDKIDVDLSCFLIDKTGQTRVDEDFIFYNQPAALVGAVKHMGDSRTGDGEGDDEEIFLDVNGIPFDVIRIALVLSIYDEKLKGWNFGMVRDLFLRLADKVEGREILRVRLNEDEFRGQTAILAGTLVREGPKWFFEVSENPVAGGLTAIAKQYGIIVREDTG